MKTALAREAAAIGFDRVGVTDPDAIGEAGLRFREFLEAGHQGDMDWLAASPERRMHPRALWPGVRSIVMLGFNYGPDRDPLAVLQQRTSGAISVYAQGDDYHDVLKKRLKTLARWLAAATGEEVKVFIDTAAVMEKPLAQAAGLGWQLHHVTETIEPIIATTWVRTPSIVVAPGQVAGLRQEAQGWMHGREVIALTWQTAVGMSDTYDAIQVDGTPPVDLVIHNGLHGDQAAAALILHAIPRVLAARPGLTTVLELPPLHYQPRPEPDAAWSPHVLKGTPVPV
mgnify:CR=1 FL=1